MGAVELGLVDTLPHLGVVCSVNAKDSSPKLEPTLLFRPPISSCDPIGEAGLFPDPAGPPRAVL